MTNRVFVVDANRNPLMPCHPARARQLLRSGRASVFRKMPFTIVLRDRYDVNKTGSQPIRVKVNPGSKTTSLALVADFPVRGATVLWAGELHHRGEAIRRALADRRERRRNRRNRKTRYRQARFLNRRRVKGWLPPSIQHRVQTTGTWVDRLQRWSPVTELSLQRVKFDIRLLENSDIEEMECQQGTLAGYELREYLLARHRHTCAYCGGYSGDPVLEREHVYPISRGGSNRLSNQVIACRTCNQAKSNRTAGEWAETLGRRTKLDRQRKINAQTVQAGQRPSLKDAAAINATRNAIAKQMCATGLPVEWDTSARTRYNRVQLGYPKEHWIDAACIGKSGEAVRLAPNQRPLTITATGHSERQRARLDSYGFPRGHKPRARSFQGFRTGDQVRVIGGKARGVQGRLSIRFRPCFAVNAGTNRRDGIHPHNLIIQQRSDGYDYAQK